MADLHEFSVGMLVADGSEQVEVTAPRDALRRAGARVHVLSPGGGDIRGYHYIQPGDLLAADASIEDADAADFDALVIPGGLGGPDTLRNNSHAIELVRATVRSARPVGVICHGPWLLIDAGVLVGRTLACVPQLAADVANAGATFVDQDVYTDRKENVLISSRDHDTAQLFADALVREFAS